MRWLLICAIAPGLITPVFADSDDACFNKIESTHRAAKGHWKGDFFADVSMNRDHPKEFTGRFDGNLEFTVASDGEHEVWPLPPPPSQADCDDMEKQGNHHVMCTPEYAEKAYKAVHMEDEGGNPVVSGNSSHKFKSDINFGSVSSHTEFDTSIHTTVKEVRDIFNNLSGLLLDVHSNQNYQGTVSLTTPYTETREKVGLTGNESSVDSTTHAHLPSTDVTVDSAEKSKLQTIIQSPAVLSRSLFELEMRSRECGFVSGPVKSFITVVPVVNSWWKAFHDERDEALENEVARFVAAPIPQTTTQADVTVADAAYKRFLGTGSDYRACVAQEAYQKLLQIKIAYAIQDFKQNYKAKVAAATEGKQVCKAGIELQENLRQMELLGMPDGCPLPGEAIAAMMEAGQAFHQRTGKWPGC